jgi:hypothetical protein
MAEPDGNLARAHVEFPGLFADDSTGEQVRGQFYGSRPRTALAAANPEIADLCLAQIKLAFADLTHSTPDAIKHREEARAWVIAEPLPSDDCADVATFRGCCEMLGIEPTALRAAMLSHVPRRRLRSVLRRTPRIQPVLLPPKRGRPPRIVVAMAGSSTRRSCRRKAAA